MTSFIIPIRISSTPHCAYSIAREMFRGFSLVSKRYGSFFFPTTPISFSTFITLSSSSALVTASIL